MEQVQVDGSEIATGQHENDFSNEGNIITNWLKIRSFRYSDSGVYQCFLRSTTSMQQQQRFPILNSITYNRPTSLQSADLNRDQLFSNTIYLLVNGKLG